MVGMKAVSGLKKRSANSPRSGFTLLELIVVITILGVLLSIALPNYRASVLQAKEAVLRENLYRLRDLIDQYQSDKGRYPDSIESLVADGYLRSVPKDPMSSEPWQEIPPEADANTGEALVGVYDVKSVSTEIGSNGVSYAEW